ncbi:MAG TPA: rhodanese-like domain-containing protein [Actinomycetes bacterium]|nr:rhodanese-like domain-containing protein [Actinomycetes bacterium]
MSLFGRLFGSVPSVSVQEARRLVDGGAVIVDVRTTAEWNAGHSPFAKHMARDQLAAKQHRIPAGKKAVVVCRSGSRSRGATKHLIAAGYDAVNLSGGMNAWARQGQLVVNRAGKPGRVA